VAACIGIHAFAVRHEGQNKSSDVDDNNIDPFINEGLSTSTEESDGDLPSHTRAPTRLQLAKRRREKLKEKLFHSKIKKNQRRAQERRFDIGGYVSTSSLSE